MKFTIQDIQAMADSRSFSRGAVYFQQHRVTDIHCDKSGKVLQGQVSGSGRKHYFTQVRQIGNELLGDCSCPVEFDCKHAVAVAMAWLSQSGANRQPVSNTSTGTSLQHWLEALPTSRTSKPAPLKYSQHYLLYFLESHQQRVQVHCQKAYLKKNGNWSQFRSFIPTNEHLNWGRPGFFLDEDLAILQLLPPSMVGVGNLTLAGEAGWLALQHMLASGRLFFRDNPVQEGPAETLKWQWQPEGSDQYLTAHLGQVAQWQLINTTPPCYFDIGQGRIGEIHAPMDSAQLEHMLALPPVPQAQMNTFALQVRQVIPEDQLPLPVEPKLTVIDTFTPHLTLVKYLLPDGINLPGLQLHFDYGDFSLTPNYYDMPEPEPLREQDGHCYRIERNTEQEDATCDQIHDQQLFLTRQSVDQPLVWVASGGTLAQTFKHWQHIIDQTLPQLAEQGWRIDQAPDFHFSVRQATFDIAIGDASNHWFDFSLQLPLTDGRSLDTAELVEHWLEADAPEDFVVNVDDEWVQVDARPLQGIRSLLSELVNSKPLNKPIRLPAFQAAQFQDIPDLDDRRAPLTRQLMNTLNDFRGIEPVAAPAGLNAELRGYQKDGLNWLAFLHRFGFGGVLADDMGLGKTLQTLALVQHLKESGALKKPALIVAPTSLTGNWLHEAARFTPNLTTTLIHGPDRDKNFKQIAKSDLVITTYPLIARDQARYRNRRFSLLVLDEAQAIKNPRTKTAACVREIKSEQRLCLTGTPLENHLGELWALMDFVLPGLLGGQKTFNQHLRRPIENDQNDECQRALAQKVAPFMLRRTKQAVVRELPDKTEILQYVELAGKQRALYESIRISMEKRIRDLVAKQGMGRSHIAFLDALLKLRQACIDPRLVKLDKAAGINESAKLEWLADTLPQLLEEGRNILIFSQFTGVLKLVEAQLKANKLTYSKLTGATRKRQQAIDRFQSGDVRLFLISLKAGGSGLNLTNADVVIHLDPWWNPAVENQATDRAHRIGQDKPVFVYKLVAADTVEERIQQMQQHKQALADALFNAAEASGLPADKEALLGLLSG